MFSVIIPLFNKELEISATINSVLCQTFKEFEILIIDDGSSDNSLKIVSEIRDSRLRVVSKSNGGVSSARNEGIKRARYDYVAFLDADDLWDATYLMEAFDAIKAHPSQCLFAVNYKIKLSHDKFYVPDFKLIDPTRRYTIVKDYFRYSQRDTILTGSSVIFHTKIFKKIGLFDPDLTHGEDLDLWFRASNEFDIVFINKCLMTYRYDSSNRSIDKVPEFRRTVLIKYTLKGEKYFDYFLSKVASRFAIGYLMKNQKMEAKYCLQKINKKSMLYFRTIIFDIMPFSVRCSAFKFYMFLKNH